MATRQRARRNAPRSTNAPLQEPLEERVDKAGQRLLAQRNAKRDAAAAKARLDRVGATKP